MRGPWPTRSRGSSSRRYQVAGGIGTRLRAWLRPQAQDHAAGQPSLHKGPGESDSGEIASA